MSKESPNKREKSRTALQTACLAASLATAFAAAPVHAAAPAGFSATNGAQTTPIYDAYTLNSSVYQGPLAIEGSSSASQPVSTINANSFDDQVTQVSSAAILPLDGSYSMVVFSDSANLIGGQSFDSEFISSYPIDGGSQYPVQGTYSESQVVNYIDYATLGLTDPNANDQSAYDEFLSNLYVNDYQKGVGTGTINAYQFTNGQFIGTINTAQLPAGSSPYTGFGLAAQAPAVPEPSPFATVVIGGALLAVMAARRRKITPHQK